MRLWSQSSVWKAHPTLSKQTATPQSLQKSQPKGQSFKLEIPEYTLFFKPKHLGHHHLKLFAKLLRIPQVSKPTLFQIASTRVLPLVPSRSFAQRRIQRLCRNSGWRTTGWHADSWPFVGFGHSCSSSIRKILQRPTNYRSHDCISQPPTNIQHNMVKKEREESGVNVGRWKNQPNQKWLSIKNGLVEAKSEG